MGHLDDPQHLTKLSRAKLGALFSQGREEEELYGSFYTRFMGCVTGISNFKDRLTRARSEKDMSSVSDEAFALLLLENSHDRWLDIFKSAEGKVHRRRNEGKRQWESEVRTKFTDGGIKYNEKGKGFKGWNNAGIERFNELFDIVKNDRRNHLAFIHQYLTLERKKSMETRLKSTVKTIRVDARNELEDTPSDAVASDDSSSDNEDI